jgi:hypothetical protein
MDLLKRLLGGAQETTVDATLLSPRRADASVHVMGEASYQPALEALAGGRDRDGVLQQSHVALLWPEPNNRYDPNAIAVKIDGRLVGYLSRDDAIWYHQPVDWLAARGRYIAVQAWLTGGWDRGGRDRGTIGCALHMGSPAETIVELALDDWTFADHRWRGKTVAFTGESECEVEGVRLDRQAQLYIAEKAGAVPAARMSKACHALVVAGDVQTAKTDQASRWGTEVVAEPAFWAEIGAPATAGRRTSPAWARGNTR